jgi:metallo-beta-lactamase family protein
VKLHFWGATRQVTGSKFCLEHDAQRVLIDCGMFQEREFKDRNWETLPVPPSELNAVVLTHAHIDHCGLLPRLVKCGFRGPIYMTRPTVDLVEIMLRDSSKIQAEDVKYKQKRHRKEGRIGPHPYEPLYDEADVDETCGLRKPVPFNQVQEIGRGITVTFRNAGHILGAASLEFRIKNGRSENRIVFSGDVGQWNKPLVRDPVRFSRADFLVMESTYGDRRHQEAGDVPSQLQEVITSAVHRGGKVVIPTFAVERAQELMYYLSQLVHQHRIPHAPVFLDSPMAVDVTGIFMRHHDCLDRDAARMLAAGKPPLHFPGLQMCRTVEESKAIRDVEGPAVIMSTSGMCDAGRIKHHLRNYLGDPNSVILFVGYQGNGTLGRIILDGKKEVRIHGRSYNVRARIAQIFGFSGHADADGLQRWTEAFDPTPRQTFLVHGEERSALTLEKTLHSRGWNVQVPHYRTTVELDG